MTESTLFSLYSYYPALFNGFSDIPVSKDLVLDEIMTEYGECTPIILDPQGLGLAISSWASRRIQVWNRIYSVITADYNPLENYDRIEETTDQHSGTGDKSSSTTYGHKINTSQSTSGDSDLTHGLTVSTTAYGYNQAAGVPSETVANTGTDSTETSSTGTGQELHSGLDRFSEQETNDLTITHSGRIHGNIGTVTAQQMAREEIELAKEMDLVYFIARDFGEKFILPLW